MKETKKFKIRTLDIVLCALFAALTAVGAFIKVPLGAVPFTMQFLFANLAVLLLGKTRSVIAISVYVFLGLCGVPIFTMGGGISYVLQPSFGYLIGFIVGAFFGGLALEKAKKKTIWAYLAASGINLAVVYTLGALYLAFIKNVYIGGESAMSAWNVLLYGALVYLPGDAASGIIGSILVRRLKPALKFL